MPTISETHGLKPFSIDLPRISREEALYLLEEAPLSELEQRGFEAKRSIYGDRITYVFNRQVNPTNLCIYTCDFCDFAARPNDARAYEHTVEDILADLSSPGLKEAHLSGGLWKSWGFTKALELVTAIRSTYPTLWIKGFTAVEVQFFCDQSKLSPRAVLERLKEAGLNVLPGGGAETLSRRLHAAHYPQKIGPDRWLEIHETAHHVGLSSNATLLFGYAETPEEIVDHLLQLRESQERSRGYESVIPLAYQPGTTQLSGSEVSRERCLRVIAVARLVADNISHVKAYWPTLRLETTAKALAFGADDIDGTIGRERIMHAAGSATPAGLDAAAIETLIRGAGQYPVQRDGDFSVIAEGTHRMAGLAR